MVTELKELIKENEKIRTELDNYLLKGFRYNDELLSNVYEQISLLIDNEIEQEKFCNE